MPSRRNSAMASRLVGRTESPTARAPRTAPSQATPTTVAPRCLPLLDERGHPRGGVGGQGQGVDQPGGPTDEHLGALDHAAHAEPPQVRERLDRRERPGALLGRRGHRAGHGVLASVLDGAGTGQHDLVRRTRSGDGRELHPARGDGAGLVQHDGVDLAGVLEHLGAADQHAHLRAAAGAHQQRGRRGQPERARAGDDQHRDGGGDGGFEPRHVARRRGGGSAAHAVVRAARVARARDGDAGLAGAVRREAVLLHAGEEHEGVRALGHRDRDRGGVARVDHDRPARLGAALDRDAGAVDEHADDLAGGQGARRAVDLGEDEVERGGGAGVDRGRRRVEACLHDVVGIPAPGG